MPHSAELSASLEDYLEVIFHLIKEKRVARSKDIAEKLNVTRASVTGALQSLASLGMVNYKPYEVTTLTEKGRLCSRDIIRRHEILSEFLEKILSVEYAEAEHTACSMEHVIPSDIADKLVEFVDFIRTCPLGGGGWLEGLADRCCRPDKGIEGCRSCVGTYFNAINERLNMSGESGVVETTLDRLKPGDRGRIIKIARNMSARRRIADMGIIKGSVAEVVKIAPLGDPMDVKIKGYHLTLRKDEAKGISVELL